MSGDTASCRLCARPPGAYVDEDPQMAEFMSGDAERVAPWPPYSHRYRISSLRALPPGRHDTLAGNEDVLREVEQVDGLRMWAVLSHAA